MSKSNKYKPNKSNMQIQAKSHLNLLNILGPSPRTKRGDFSSLDIAKNHLLYFNSVCLIVRSLDANEPIKYFIHKSQVLAAKFSRTGLIASIDQKGTLLIHELGKDKLYEVKKYQNVYMNAKAIAWSGDNKRICIVGAQKGSFGRVLLVDSGTNAGEITGVSANLTCCSFRPERPYHLALAGDQMITKFFQGPPYKFVKSSAKNHSNFINVVSFSPLGTYLLTTGSDKKLIIYDGSTLELICQMISSHTGSIYGSDWIDEDRFITVSADKSIKVWLVKGLEELGCIKCCEQDQEKDSKKVASFQVALKYYQDKIYSLNLNGQIKVYQVPKTANKFNQSSVISSFASWQDKPCKILTLSKSKVIVLDSNGKILTININKQQKSFQTLLLPIVNKISSKSIVDGFYSNKSQKLFVLWGDTNISQLKISQDFKTLQQTFSIEETQSKFIVQSFSNNYQFLIINNKIDFYQANKIIKSSQVIQEDVTFVNNSQRIIVVGTIRGNILVYDTESLQQLSVLKISSTKISCIKIIDMPDSINIICGDALGKLKILSYQSNKLNQISQSLGNHQSLITGVISYKTSLQYLFTLAMDSKINLWIKLTNQNRYKRVEDWKNQHQFGIKAAYIHKGQIDYLFTIGEDYLIKIWHISKLS